MQDNETIKSKMRIEEGNRKFGYDLIKTIAMYCVVTYHLGCVDTGVVTQGETYIPNFTKILYSLCVMGVPLFFMTNGALTCNKYKDFSKCIKKGARLLVLSFFWGTLISVIRSLIFEDKHLSIGVALDCYWFLNSLVLIYVVTYLLNKNTLLKNITFVGILLFPFLSNLIWDVFVFFNPEIEIPWYGHTGFLRLYSIVYYYLGFTVANTTLQKGATLSAIIIGWGLVCFEVIAMSTHDGSVFDGVNASFPTIGALLLSFGVFHLSKDITMTDCRFKKFVTWIGKNTLGIFIFNSIFADLIYNFIFCGNRLATPLALIISFCIMIICGAISHYILKSKLSFLLKT